MNRQCEYREVYDPRLGRHIVRHIYRLKTGDSPDSFMIYDPPQNLSMIEQNDEYGLIEPNYEPDNEYSWIESTNEEQNDEYGWIGSTNEEQNDEYDLIEPNDEYGIIEPNDEYGLIEPNDEENEDLSDMCFKEKDLDILRTIKLPQPSTIKDSDLDSLYFKVNRLIDFFGKKKAAYTKHNDKKMCKTADMLITLLKIYRDILHPEKDQTGGRYKQNRRNAYKIGAGGKYGDLVIHLPGLFTDHILEAFKNGKRVIKQPIDGDTIDLLTKRFNSNKPYSNLSRKVFHELNRLGGLPNHRSSMKFNFV